jgi:hypothetical protein
MKSSTPAAPGRTFQILPVNARSGKRSIHSQSLLQVIRNSKKHVVPAFDGIPR